MIPIKTMREEFGLAERITPNVFRAELESRSALTHYYFRSVRGELPDLLATSRGKNDEDFAVRFLESLATTLKNGEIPPGKLHSRIDNGYGFDSALILTPEYHGHLKGILDDKRKSLVYCVPIHDCEFTGKESPPEYREWQVRVEVENWMRKPFPFVSSNFGNSKSSQDDTIMRTTVDACMNALKAIDGVAENPVVVSNAWSRKLRIALRDVREYVVTGDNINFACTFDELAAILIAFVSNNEISPDNR